MSTTTIQLKELNGAQLYYSILAGAQRIFEHQKLLNKINVFPVPDADTGTNLASTMRSIIDAKIPVENLKQTAAAIADAALNGARGNSGIIFAQFLYGFSNEIRNEQTLDIRSFAESMKKAVSYAYEAIANPVEGTILTVIKDWAEHLDALKDIIDDFIRLLVEAYQKALESLASTTSQLEVLSRAHVVDAGAKGFVYFLEGIKDFFTRNEGVSSIVEPVDEETEEVDFENFHEDEITFRFCTEALLTGTSLDKNRIREILSTAGDSLVVAGSTGKVRVHIHTDFPAEVFLQLSRMGEIVYQKVDDMVFQNEIRHNRKSDIALLTDSTCDLPKEIIDRYQIHVMPLTVHFGESFYLDRVTIHPQQFYHRQALTEVRPTTSQPTTKDFQNKYEYLLSHYRSAIGMFISDKLSGTFQNGQRSAQEVSERSGNQTYIFNSKKLSAAIGMIVLRVARAIEEGKSEEEILPHVEDWISKSHIMVSIPTLKYIIKSGRISHFKSLVARVLDLKPVISLKEDGSSEILDKSFSEKSAQRKVLGRVRKLLAKNEVWEYAITHAENQAVADYYAVEMEKMTGKKPVFIDHISPVLVANTGPGVVAISLMLK